MQLHKHDQQLCQLFTPAYLKQHSVELVVAVKNELGPLRSLLCEHDYKELVDTVSTELFGMFVRVPVLRAFGNLATNPLSEEMISLATSLVGSAGLYHSVSDVPNLVRGMSSELFEIETIKAACKDVLGSRCFTVFGGTKNYSACQEQLCELFRVALDRRLSRKCNSDTDRSIPFCKRENSWVHLQEGLLVHGQVLEIQRVSNRVGCDDMRYRVRSSPWFVGQRFSGYVRSDVCRDNLRSPWCITPNYWAHQRRQCIGAASLELSNMIPRDTNPSFAVRGGALRGASGPQSRVSADVCLFTGSGGSVSSDALDAAERILREAVPDLAKKIVGKDVATAGGIVVIREMGVTTRVTSAGEVPYEGISLRGDTVVANIDPDQPGLLFVNQGRSHFKRKPRGASQRDPFEVNLSLTPLRKKL